MSTTEKHGADLVDHLFPLQPPRTPEVADAMDQVRAAFTDLGHLVAEVTPPGEQQKRVIYDLHAVCQAAIGNLACNQPDPPDEEEA